MIEKIRDFLFPASLWNRRFTYWWLISFATLLVFDLMWMAQTTFRPFCYIAFYPYLLLNATLLTLPAALSRRAWIQAAVLLVADVIMTANLMYCRTYFDGIPAESYLIAGNLADFTDSVSNSFQWYYAFLPLLTAGAWGASGYFVGRDTERPGFGAYAATVLVLGILAWAADAWRGQSLLKTVDGIRNECKANMCVLPVYQISGFVVFDLLSGNEPLTPEREQDMNSWLADHQRLTGPYYSAKAADDTIAHPDNLLIILCESLESWVLEKDVEGKEITPNLNRLLKAPGTFYAPNVLTQVGHGRSIDGQLLVMAGLLPHSSQVYAYRQPDNFYYSLPKAMKANGGRSMLLTGDRLQVWNQGLVAEAFGIDSVVHSTSWDLNAPGNGRKRSLSDGELMKQSVDKMRKGEIWRPGEKEMIVWVTHSGHDPFKIDKELRRIDLKGDYSESVADYMTAANYTDYAIGILIDYLKTRPDWERTMVVITGDHEGLGKLRDKAVKHPGTASMVDPLQHTPLIILNSPVGGRYGGEMGQVDIYSTLIALMGWYDYPWKGIGQSIFDPSFPGVAVNSRHGAVGSVKDIKSSELQHLREAQKVSSDIIQYDMLKRNE